MPELEKIQKALETLNWVNKFLNYITLRKQGLRKKSQIELKDFFKDFYLQNKGIRRNFIDLVCTLAFITDDYSTYLPVNMYNDIFLPEISVWIKEEPYNAIPYKWSNELKNNKKSIELNPQDQIALEKFANRLIGRISVNQHEIKYGYPYDGNPNEDLHLIDFFEKVVGNITDLKKQENIYQKILELKQCASKYNLSKK